MLDTKDAIIVTLLLICFLGVPVSADSAQLRQMEYEFITNHDYKIPRDENIALLIVESPIEGLLFDTTNRIIGTSYPHPGIYELRLAPGRHVLTISVEGYVTLQGIRLTLQPKQVSALRVTPKPSAPARFDPEGRRIEGGESDWDLQILPQHVVTFETDPPGAEVRIDGEYRCATPCNRELQEGTHQITLRLSRYAEIEETLTVSGPLTVRRELTPLFGWISVATEPPGLEVQLNGQRIGTSPVVRYEVDPGRHTVMVVDPRYHETGVEGFEISGNEHREFDVFRPVAREGALTVRAVTADARKEPLARPVQIGGRDVGQTPWTGRLPVGQHRVTVEGQVREVTVVERETVEEVFEVAVAPPVERDRPREERPIASSPVMRTGSSRTNRFIVIGGLAAVAGAGYFHFAADGAYDDHVNADTIADAIQTWDDYRRNTTLRNVSLGVAAGMITWRLIRALSAPQTADARHATVDWHQQPGAMASMRPTGHIIWAHEVRF